jgi:hypothetical protein
MGYAILHAGHGWACDGPQAPQGARLCHRSGRWAAASAGDSSIRSKDSASSTARALHNLGDTPWPALLLGASLLTCAVLCCAVLCCAVLCCAVLCCAVLCCAGKDYKDARMVNLKQTMDAFAGGDADLRAAITDATDIKQVSVTHFQSPGGHSQTCTCLDAMHACLLTPHLHVARCETWCICLFGRLLPHLVDAVRLPTLPMCSCVNVLMIVVAETTLVSPVLHITLPVPPRVVYNMPPGGQEGSGQGGVHV